jgi:PAS domain S-box-containing protein
VSLNKPLAEMNRAPIVAHLGRTVAEMIPEFYVQLEPYIKRALNGEAFSGLEFKAKLADGTVQARSTSYEPTRDEAGEVVGLSVAVVDITERDSADAALRESEDHHRYAVELNPQVPWTANAEGRIVEGGSQWTALTGMPVEQALGSGWIKAVHPDDIGPMLELWKVSLVTGESVDYEHRVRTREGEWRWMRARATARRDESGKIIRWYGALEDIDDYKRAQNELLESGARLQAVFEAVPVGIVIAKEPSGQVVIRNSQAETILGVEIKEGSEILVPERWTLPDGRQVKAQEHPLVRAIRLGETTAAEEFCYERDDKSRVGVSVTAAPVRGVDGGILGGVLTIRAS